LLLILQQRTESLHGIYNLLRPGGALLIAEPKESWRTELPLICMNTLDRLTMLDPARKRCEHTRTLSFEELDTLLTGQPWSKISRWQDSRYQYALCEKAALDTSLGIAS
jgi:hypothetical protein